MSSVSDNNSHMVIQRKEIRKENYGWVKAKALTSTPPKEFMWKLNYSKILTFPKFSPQQISKA